MLCFSILTGPGFFDIYNEEKGDVEQHAVNIVNVCFVFLFSMMFSNKMLYVCNASNKRSQITFSS